MNILVINGSPKGPRSNSLQLAHSFLEGFQAQKKAQGVETAVEQLDVAALKISPCKGCFACWQATPGKCCIRDDMATVLEKMLGADLILWSFPLYYYNVPGILKNLIDRQLPLNLPFMSQEDPQTGSGGHDARYGGKAARHVLLSTCGFYSAQGNYDSVTRMFDHFLGPGNYTTLFCGQGELFRVPELSSRTGEYLALVRSAGAEYAEGAVSEVTEAALHQLLFPREVFEQMADASWGVSKESGEKETEDLSFTRQMAALYNKASYDGRDRVLEMHYTDLDATYQILLGKDGSKVLTDGSLSPTTRIDTPFSVWTSISRGEISGSEALGQGLYTVSGDFSLMIDWDRFFGGGAAQPAEAPREGAGRQSLKAPTMAAMLIPWITFWIAVSFSATLGAVITAVVCALVPLLLRRHELVLWDHLSLAAVAGLSLAAFLTGDGALMTNLGYLVFGLFWLVSCLLKEPLCAAYVKANYGGDKALQNPLFMKTNTILAICWGVLYLLTALWTFFLRQAGFGTLLLVVNNLVPIAMGVFTAWFEKWYPAFLAGGGRKKP